jgi:pimeloyl-ACP methyl ester carboxylesterase
LGRGALGRPYAFEQRLYDETWRVGGYDLIPKLRCLDIPTLVLHREHDFVPTPIAVRIADALPRGRLVGARWLRSFAPLELPEGVHQHIATLFESN